MQDKASPVDTINGFVEVYLDARGIKGAWEALVFYVNREKTDGDPERSRPTRSGSRTACRGIRSTASRACTASPPTPSTSSIETGDSGPITPVGINLPNDQAIRERYGSKSVSLSNVNEAYDKSTLPEFRSEFSWTPEEAARADEVERASPAS